MDRYTIVVEMMARDQRAAFEFVEQAITEKLERERMRDHCDGDIRVSTPDGTQSVVF